MMIFSPCALMKVELAWDVRFFRSLALYPLKDVRNIIVVPILHKQMIAQSENLLKQWAHTLMTNKHTGPAHATPFQYTCFSFGWRGTERVTRKKTQMITTINGRNKTKDNLHEQLPVNRRDLSNLTNSYLWFWREIEKKPRIELMSNISIRHHSTWSNIMLCIGSVFFRKK